MKEEFPYDNVNMFGTNPFDVSPLSTLEHSNNEHLLGLLQDGFQHEDISPNYNNELQQFDSTIATDSTANKNQQQNKNELKLTDSLEGSTTPLGQLTQVSNNYQLNMSVPRRSESNIERMMNSKKHCFVPFVVNTEGGRSKIRRTKEEDICDSTYSEFETNFKRNFSESDVEGLKSKNVKKIPTPKKNKAINHGKLMQMQMVERNGSVKLEVTDSCLTEQELQTEAIVEAEDSADDKEPLSERESEDTKTTVKKKYKGKTSHNIIEKKYRKNLNDKILQLRDIVPTLRVTHKKNSKIPLDDKDFYDLAHLNPTRKLNKGSILTKAIEYIQYLEEKCSKYEAEGKVGKVKLKRLEPSLSSTTYNSQTISPDSPNSGNINDKTFSTESHLLTSRSSSVSMFPEKTFQSNNHHFSPILEGTNGLDGTNDNNNK
ncbi:Hms1p NDAI_0F00860 [Naumovozyma dairenensis CBS 421]|uniref:BHLH domain-containing protein n=1 Tax=Naumovozyma dairenensis (strain ATCC 10597 / BCRC 20456 / CBS 421 / NBRC 0211 / NRRL Y-12639) TaxID=1071378 RepID=G0WC94_NAUDC|nr:hypothetical protein NDAI_0F00860 [Naumovozyma dairenensis CBS 421]CCD25405.1 hypothetical protein NDAI_0F00860 [Naumovozyma dairenensis CBS 421]